ncbi:hypothetical protein RhiJN_04515 [Ceratobasidium sp. AG-Ba]|nr:hypothetical protein RhiJN_04515 [Ceratobasidium sp. AG-Ba]
MWVVSGPFDGVQDGAKEKLLKPGKTYTVGREKSAGGQSQDGRINIDSKSISHEHIDLIIGKYEIDDVSDIQARPTIQLVVKREKDIWVGSTTQRVTKGVVHNLESGDEIGLTNKISIYVLWKPVVVVNADSRIKKDRMREIALESSKLGITVSKSWMDSATHFATQSINLSRRPLHCLMLGISLVDTKWLEEVFRRGSRLPIDSGPDDQGVVALESHFILPDERDFRPQLQASEDEDEDVTEWPVELWDANSDRKLIWKGLQFHFFCDDSPPTEWTDQAQLGGATFKSHNFNPEDPADRISKVEQANMLFQNIRLGASKLGQVPGMKSSVVIVIKPSELVATLGKTVWRVYQEGMRNNGFKYVTPRDVTQAVLRMDVSSIDCGLEMVPPPGKSNQQLKKASTTLSSLPDFVPPSHTGDISVTGPLSSIAPSTTFGAANPEVAESTKEVPKPRLLKRRPRAASPEPSAPVVPELPPASGPVNNDPTSEPLKEESVVEPPRRLLKRRVKTTTIAEVLGLDESSASIDPGLPPAEKPASLRGKDAVIDLSKEDTPPPITVKPPSSTVSRTNRLKRRADVLAERTTTPAVAEEIALPQEPALKRYRQLFEGTASTVGPSPFDNTHGDNVPADPTTTTSGRKRKPADRDEGSDIEMAGPTQSKRREVAAESHEPTASGSDRGPGHSHTQPNVGSNQSQPPAQSQSHLPGVTHTRAPGTRGAAPGAPDKDRALLDALANKDGDTNSAATSNKDESKKSSAAIDKEFANMRIAQENEEKEAASRKRAEEMRIWEECERDVDVRGNFMVIELVDLVRRNRGAAARSVNPAWQGRPDFKKFKKKLTGPRGPRVQLFVNDEEVLDYGIGDNYWEQNGPPSETQTHTGDMSRTKIRTVQDVDSDTPMPQNTKSTRGRSVAPGAAKAGVNPQAEPKTKPKPKTRRIAVEDSDDSDQDGLSRIGGASASVVGARRRPVPSSARKTNLADFGMRDDDSVSEGENRRSRNKGVRPDDDTFTTAGRAGDEEAVSEMMAQESAKATPTNALSHMSSLGSASLGVRKPAAQSSTTKRAKAPLKKVVVIDSDSDGGGFKGFGTKRRKRGAAPPSS